MQGSWVCCYTFQRAFCILREETLDMKAFSGGQVLVTSRLLLAQKIWQKLICIKVRVKLLMEVVQHPRLLATLLSPLFFFLFLAASVLNRLVLGTHLFTKKIHNENATRQPASITGRHSPHLPLGLQYFFFTLKLIKIRAVF